MASPLKRVLLSPVLWLFLLLGGLAAIVFGFAVGSRDGNRDLQREQTTKLLGAKTPTGVVDENTGNYRGIVPGDSAATVIRRLGRPLDPNAQVMIPRVANGTVWNGLNVGDCGARPRRAMVYREVVVHFGTDRLCAYEVAGGGWATRSGIDAGDPVTVVQERFGKNACHEWNPSEDPFWSQWTCEIRLGNGLRLEFAGDPVTSVAVTRNRIRRSSD